MNLFLASTQFLGSTVAYFVFPICLFYAGFTPFVSKPKQAIFAFKADLDFLPLILAFPKHPTAE